MYYLRARYYDPIIGRFITQDTLFGEMDNPLTQNLYVYCGNNPVLYVDPSGHLRCESLSIDPKAVQDYVIQYIKDFFSGFGDYLDDKAKDMAVAYLEWRSEGIPQFSYDENGNPYLTPEEAEKLIYMLPVAGLEVQGEKILANAIGKGAGKNVFKTQDLLDSHYVKHVKEFGNITKDQYLKGAQNLVNSKPGGNILTKTRSNGDVLFYNKAKNEFAVKASDGTIRTYFKPTDGIDYFYRQK